MELKKACAKEPGIVLADNDAGHFIRYYTECSVIADNFLLTKQQAEKIELADHLFGLSSDDMPVEAPYVRYVLVRPVFLKPRGDSFDYVAYSQDASALLVAQLLLAPVNQVPQRYTLLKAATIKQKEDSKESSPYIRLYKVAGPHESPATPQGQGSIADNSRH
jgi:hypothetical protein